ncbi:MAG: type III-A CRISPR-associated protein Cas10/Csm1 [bacterium]
MTGNEYYKSEDVLKPILIEGLLKVRDWFHKQDAPYLRSIFDQVGFKDKDETISAYYVKPTSITSNISYPTKVKDVLLDEIKAGTLNEIKTRYESLDENYLRLLTVNKLMFLLEKFGGTIPIEGNENISIFDTYKVRAAKAIIARNRKEFKHDPGNLIINLDLSGIQSFIYNITSQGALKNLRSRSFFIELLCNHAIDRCIDAFNLHDVNILMNGGGNIYILSSKPPGYNELLGSIDYNINSWLLEKFNGRLHITFSTVEASDENLKFDISSTLQEIAKAAFIKKNQKFQAIIQKGDLVFINETDPSPQHCEICFRDSVLPQPKGREDYEEPIRCSFCDRLVRLGNVIPEIRYVQISNEDSGHCLQIENSYYLLSKVHRYDLPCRWVIYDERIDFLNDLGTSAIPLFARTYVTTVDMLPKDIRQDIAEEKEELYTQLSATEDQEEKQWLKDEIDSLGDKNAAMLEHLAASSRGAKLIGALRMDADNMGKIISKGFRGQATLEKLSSFSRNLNYLFRLYLGSLNKDRTIARAIVKCCV